MRRSADLVGGVEIPVEEIAVVLLGAELNNDRKFVGFSISLR